MFKASFGKPANNFNLRGPDKQGELIKKFVADSKEISH